MTRTAVLLLCLAAFALSPAPRLGSQTLRPQTAEDQKGSPAMQHATGTFEVKVAPAEASELGKAASLGRMTLDKTFAGELRGTSKGEMLTGMTPETGAAAYVALERVTGELAHHSGSFLLMHQASMLKGGKDPKMTVTIAPESGTGELTGITGAMTITIDSHGGHSYDLAYTLPEANP